MYHCGSVPSKHLNNMMKLVILFTFIVAGLAAPQYYNTPRPYAILRSDNELYPDGSYTYGYDTENGISVNEQGQQRSGTIAQGSYQYTSPEGKVIQIQYIADENGYQPIGNAIPGSQSTVYRNY